MSRQHTTVDPVSPLVIWLYLPFSCNTIQCVWTIVYVGCCLSLQCLETTQGWVSKTQEPQFRAIAYPPNLNPPIFCNGDFVPNCQFLYSGKLSHFESQKFLPKILGSQHSMKDFSVKCSLPTDLQEVSQFPAIRYFWL